MGKLNRKQKPKVKLKRNRPKPIPICENHYERIKSYGRKICCVCDKPFKSHHREVYLGVYDGMEMYRHQRCDCFSEAWKKKFRGCIKLINH